MKRARTSSSPAPHSSTSASAHPRSRSTMASSAAASGASSSAPAAAEPPCPHLYALLPSLAPPRSAIAVHRSECTLCFDGAEADGGIDVCLTCFNGGCCAPERNHARAHADKTWHALVCNVRRRRRAKEVRSRLGTMAPGERNGAASRALPTGSIKAHTRAHVHPSHRSQSPWTRWPSLRRAMRTSGSTRQPCAASPATTARAGRSQRLAR